MPVGKRRLTQQISLVAGVIGLHALVFWMIPNSHKSADSRPLTVRLQPVALHPDAKQHSEAQPVQAINQYRVHPTPQRQSVSKRNTPAVIAAITPALWAASPPAPVTAVATDSAEKTTQTAAANPGGSPQAAASVLPATQLPSSSADYLHNPPPVYPEASLRWGEQGKVVIRVLIDKDGLAHQGSIQQSSGFDRLDRAALQAVMNWRYVPATRAGIAQDMWFDVPLNFAPN